MTTDAKTCESCRSRDGIPYTFLLAENVDLNGALLCGQCGQQSWKVIAPRIRSNRAAKAKQAEGPRDADGNVVQVGDILVTTTGATHRIHSVRGVKAYCDLCEYDGSKFPYAEPHELALSIVRKLTPQPGGGSGAALRTLHEMQVRQFNRGAGSIKQLRCSRCTAESFPGSAFDSAGLCDHCQADDRNRAQEAKNGQLTRLTPQPGGGSAATSAQDSPEPRRNVAEEPQQQSKPPPGSAPNPYDLFRAAVETHVVPRLPAGCQVITDGRHGVNALFLLVVVDASGNELHETHFGIAFPTPGVLEGFADQACIAFARHVPKPRKPKSVVEWPGFFSGRKS